MRRQVLVGLAVVIAVVAGIGLLAWAGTQGILGGKPKRLLHQAEQAAQQGKLPEAQAALEQLLKAFPDAPIVDQAILQLGAVYEQQQKLVEARTMYRLLLDRFPNSSRAAEAQTDLGRVNVALLFSPIPTDNAIIYEVKPGDSLGRIAEANGTTVELLKKSNRLNSNVIRPGQKLKVPKSRFSILVDKSLNQLLLKEDGQFFKLYRVATGENNSSPVGMFKIVNKVPNPVWYRQGAAVPPNSPDNILGTRWLGLEKAGYGIHGSVDPSGIGKQVTAGCVRMNNPEVEELFAIVPIGTDVTIVD